ncbi:MAG: ABC transporter permease [Chloroflexota bacterium]
MAVESPDPAIGPPQAVPTGGQAAPAASRASRSVRTRELARALLHSKTFLIGVAILLFWILDSFFSSLVVPHDPQAVDPIATLQGPSASHLFGTDDLGRDVFSRVLAGASSVLTVAPLATLLGVLGGVTVGLVTGYYRGLVDDVLMRIVDALLAFPILLIAILVLTVLGPSIVNVILVIGIAFTPLVARTVRASVLVEREREYVAAARLLGEPGIKIMVREILPNITAPIAVESTVRLGYAIFTSATLSFLGLGIQPPSADWGLTISLGRGLLQVAPWIVLFPSLALATLVVALNFVADGLKQVLED